MKFAGLLAFASLLAAPAYGYSRNSLSYANGASANIQRSDAAIVQNFPDHSWNSATNAVARGGVVVLYGTGLGKLPYPLSTGEPGVVPPATYLSTYSCSFAGEATSAYSYWDYGFVGLAIWTVTVPPGSPMGAVQLICTDSSSGASTLPGTIYIE